MNLRFFTHKIMLLTLLGCVASCSSSEIEFDENGIIPYAYCPCEEGQIISSFVSSIEEALLIKDPTSEQWGNMSGVHSKRICWIVYDSKTDTAELFISAHDGDVKGVGLICNFPDFAKEWDIPQKGVKVFYNGTSHWPDPPRGGLANAAYFDFILTYLKRK